MSEICQFAINNRLSHFDQLTIAIEMIQMLCDSKTDETNKKIVEVRRNQGDSDSNNDSKRLKFVSLLSTIKQIILINLQPQ